MDLQLLQHYNSQHGGRHSFAMVESHRLKTNALEAMCHMDTWLQATVSSVAFHGLFYRRQWDKRTSQNHQKVCEKGLYIH